MRRHPFPFAISLLTAASVAGQNVPAVGTTGGFPRGEAVIQVATLADPDYTYALYLPSAYDPRVKWPVLYALDPRGRALMAMDLFRDAAERNGFIVISSYETRSDTDNSVTTLAFQALLNDVPRRFSFDPQRLVVAGMSGTAHAAWRFAQVLEGRLAGIIACAGGVQTQTYGAAEGTVPFAYYGITMTDDFNYQEMMRLEEHLTDVGSPHHFEVTAGRHGWPTPEATARALDWMALQFTLQGFPPPTEDFVESQLAERRRFIATLTDPLRRLRHLRSLHRDFGGNAFNDQEALEFDRLVSSDEVAEARKLERKLRSRENAYLTGTLSRWQRSLLAEGDPPGVARSLVQLYIGRLHTQAQDLDPRRAASARRLLENAYTVTSFYLPRSLRAEGRDSRAEIALRTAAEIFPDRAWTHWQLANLHLDNGRNERAIKSLAAALERGFLVSHEQLRQDPRWATARSLPEWSQMAESAGDGEAEDTADGDESTLDFD